MPLAGAILAESTGGPRSLPLVGTVLLAKPLDCQPSRATGPFARPERARSPVDDHRADQACFRSTGLTSGTAAFVGSGYGSPPSAGAPQRKRQPGPEASVAARPGFRKSRKPPSDVCAGV